MISAVQMYRSLPRYVATRAVAGRLPGLASTPVAPLHLVHVDPPRPPAAGWVEVRPMLSGICGSDLAAVSGRTSLYFSGLVTLPFTPGHEVVGELLTGCEDLPAGTRVVLDPLLTCAARGLAPCAACSAGTRQRCVGVTGGHVRPGLQTGFCADTGGGWSSRLVAHRSQLHPVPQDVAAETAVLCEPLACALHVAERAAPEEGATVLVVGAGAVGLLTTLALRQTTPAGRIVTVAKHPHQVELAHAFGASEVVSPDTVLAAVRRSTGALRVRPERARPFLLGGVEVCVDAAGTRDSLETALHATAAGGRVVLAAMPASPDLSAAWFRELEVRGAYAGGPAPGGAPAFPLALRLAAEHDLGRLVSARYRLDQWREALDHSFAAGRLGATKVVFDLRDRTGDDR